MIGGEFVMDLLATRRTGRTRRGPRQSQSLTVSSISRSSADHRVTGCFLHSLDHRELHCNHGQPTISTTLLHTRSLLSVAFCGDIGTPATFGTACSKRHTIRQQWMTV